MLGVSNITPITYMHVRTAQNQPQKMPVPPENTIVLFFGHSLPSPSGCNSSVSMVQATNMGKRHNIDRRYPWALRRWLGHCKLLAEC